MELDYKKVKELCDMHGICDHDVDSILLFVHDLLMDEADETARRYPYAVVTVSDLRKAAYTVFSISSDISAGNFGGG